MWHKLVILLSLVSLLAPAGTASAALIAYWPLDGDAKDAADGHDGTVVGGAEFVQDADRGTVLKVDGVDGHILVPHSKDFEFTASDSYTIMAWAYVDAVTGTWQGIMAESRSDDVLHYGIWVTDSGEWMGGGWENRGSAVPVKVWVHVAYVQNGATGRATTYVNGVADWTGGTRDGSGPGDFWIGGAELPSPEGPPHEMFAGLIDDVRIYNHALTAAEIKAFIPPKLKAYNPQPADGATGVSLPLLQWAKGDTARFHNVYLGTTPELTEAHRLTPPKYTQVSLYYMTGFEPGVKFYWRVDEVEADGTTIHTGRVWSFTSIFLTAYAPVPADGSADAAQAPVLSWSPGQNAAKHHLYFGDDLKAVQEGAATTDKGELDSEQFAVGLLRAGTRYFWRVNEIDALDEVRTGPVWSFTTRDPVQGKVLREWWLALNGTAIDNLTADPRYPGGPDGSELLNSFEGPVDWADNYGSCLSGWLVPAKSGDYTFWIASDDNSELWLSTDLDPNHAEVIAGVIGWTGSQEWENMPSQKSAPVTLQAGQKYYIQALQKEGTGGDNLAVAWQPPGGARAVIAGEFVQTYALPPLKAAAPFPPNGAVDVVQTLELSWFAGEKAQQHEVYLGTDQAAVAAADTTSVLFLGRQAGTTFDAGALEWGKTYFWKVCEINPDEPDSPRQGSVWSFTTADFILVDDFESYNDEEGTGTRIYETWIDGWADGSSGSIVGYTQPPFAERVTVHGGRQSMPLDYNNVNAPYYSEAQRTWPAPQDWTVNGVDSLTLYVRGRAGNDPAALYVTLTDSAGNSATVSYGDDTVVTSSTWREWKIPLSSFGGVNPAKVKTLCLGVGDRVHPAPGARGLLYLDDIRVTRP